ncbi:MAG: hypothetical protein ACYTBP_13365 [Planctomycetota bacterium]|jgi:hypothetical protein
MKEIDFLPEWYKSGMRMRVNFRTQYIALGSIFALMLIWNFGMLGTISKVRGDVSHMHSRVSEVTESSQEYSRLIEQVGSLQDKARLLDKIDSKIDVSSIFGELGFIVADNIVLSKLEITAEEFAGSGSNSLSGVSGRLISVGGISGNQGRELADVRFRVTINGVAAEPKNVAELICSLEDSPYFFQVIPSYSRSREIKGGSKTEQDGFQASEFELVCYLANYTEQKKTSGVK